MLNPDKHRRVYGFGSVHGSPGLPHGFTDVFESYLIDIGDLALHAVIGGDGPPLLLLAGWPQNWYVWRHLMLPLADKFTVIAVDPRGVGVSDKLKGGYDSKTLASDQFSLMDALGHERFAMVGHDIGAWTGYAMAADRPGRIERIVLGEAVIPGVSPSFPLLPDDRRISDLLWHFNFNRALAINEALVAGREEIYFGHQLRSKAGSPDAIPNEAQAYYIELLKRDPEALRASFDYYRAIDDHIPQNRERAREKLTLPVFTFAGALAAAEFVEHEIRSVASDVQSVIIPDSGHYVADETPAPLLEAILPFLAPYAASGG